MTAVSSHPDDLAALDKYRIVREVGRGGMAVVYEAIEKTLSRRVALKVLPQAATFDSRQLARFQNEAITAARLDHAHIVPLYTVGCQNGVHFYAMKFIDGGSLAEVIADVQQFEPDRECMGPVRRRHPRCSTTHRDFFLMAARWGIQAAEALQHAHAHGITHGDVKPANLLIDAQEKLWLADFGLARSTSDPRHRGAMSPGTLRFLSPEQARAEHAAGDHRSDIYSLGATLYELVTLQPANPGTTPSAILGQIAFGTVALPSEHNPRIPRVLQAILCRALAANPRDRYATAQQLAEDLECFISGRQVLATRSVGLPRIRRRWLPRPAVLLGAIALTALISLPPLIVTDSRIERSAPARLSPAHEALKQLRMIETTDLDRLYETQSRGEAPSNWERQLLENGPEIYQPASDWERKSFVEQGMLNVSYPLKLSQVFYQLAEIHRRLGNGDLQGRMLRKSNELLENLPSQVETDYRLPLALVSMAEAEVHAAAGRYEEASRLGSSILDTLGATRDPNGAEKSPDRPDDQIVAAWLHTRFGRMLAAAIPPSDAQLHHRIAIDLLERLIQETQPPYALPFVPYEYPHELLAECRVNLASSLGAVEESKANLELVIEYLADRTPGSGVDFEWHMNLLAQAERDLGVTLHRLGQREDGHRHLRRSIELFDRLVADYPAVVEYRQHLAKARSTIESMANLPSPGTNQAAGLNAY